jgi:hypothetical protein
MNRSQYWVIAIAASCAAAFVALPAHAQTYTEVQVSPVGFGDIEFDWGRDGVSCPNCNYRQGNARFNWTDTDENLWIGHLDPATGAFTPTDGNNELVDTHAFFWKKWGNGPEWAFSSRDGAVISQLVYTRYPPDANEYASAAFATMENGVWVPQYFPGEGGPFPTQLYANTTIQPVPSQCNTDPGALVLFHNIGSPPKMYWEPVSSAAGTAPTLTPFGSYANLLVERFVPCTHQLVFQGPAPPDSSGNVYAQIFWYDIDTGAVDQLTTSPYRKHGAFMFRAPEFDDNYVLFTVSNSREIDVYQQTGTKSDGSPKFTLINQIMSPDLSEPFINSPEPFINCTPTCQTYIFMTLSATYDSQTSTTVPNGLAITNINPAQPFFKILVPAASRPPKQRLDPEYFITAKGPYLYYERTTVQTDTTPYKTEGEWYIDLQLGVPSGACVGSSAQDGLLPGC